MEGKLIERELIKIAEEDGLNNEWKDSNTHWLI